MTPQQATRVEELLRAATAQLEEAISITERSSSTDVACSIGAARDRLARLTEKVAKKKEPRARSARSFIREHGL